MLIGEEHLDREVRSACGSDMMSDVLAFSKDHSMLLTGLCNPQVIRTAEMLDIVCIIFVRGKKPDDTVLQMAKERDLVVLATDTACFPPAACCIRPDWAEVRYNGAIVLKYPISADDFTRAGEASSDVKSKLKQMGVPPEVIRKVSIALYEGEINMVIHAKGGRDHGGDHAAAYLHGPGGYGSRHPGYR